MENFLNDIIKNIQQIVHFDSAQQPALPDMPFGEGCANALRYYLDLAKFFGFETKNYDNYVGEVTFGKGEDFAVLAHLDVVPVGSGWHHDPLGEIDYENKRIWGRGTMDDKGPAIIILHALKALKDESFTPKKKIKLILGCNEESGWGCIEHYNKVAKMPEYGISPDANFPVIYAEKGILHIDLHAPAKEAAFSGLLGGTAANMVCDNCQVTAAYDERKGKRYGVEKSGALLVTRGKSAHGSTPQDGVNAIEPMLRYLGLENLADLLFTQKLGLGDFADETGPLTLSPDMIRQENDEIIITCDIRYPATYAQTSILNALEKQELPFEILHHQPPLYNDKNCKLIQTLCGVYNEVTGKNVQPIAIGGGTYARALKCGAGFGPEEDGEEQTIHQPDEYITFEKIEKCYKIYKLALQRLTED